MTANQSQSFAPPASAGRQPPRTSTRRREVKKFLLALAYLSQERLIFLGFVFIPLVRSFLLSLQRTDPIGRAVGYAGLLQYQRLWENPQFLNSLQRTLLFVLYTVPTSMVLAMGLALLGNLRLRRISIFRMIFSLTIAVSAATASLIFLYLFHPALGWLNYLLSLVGVPPVPWLTDVRTALPAVAIVSVWLQLGLNTVILLAGMQGIPEELYESAMIDGASGLAKFRHITLPLLSPTTFFLIILSTIGALQAFTHIVTMNQAANQPKGGPLDTTLTATVYLFKIFYGEVGRPDYSYASAVAFVLFFIILALTVLQRWIGSRYVHYS